MGCLDWRTDFIPLFPLRRLLIGVYLISQPQFGEYFQPEVTKRIPGLAATHAMVGRAYRALVRLPGEPGLKKCARGVF